MTMAGCNTFDQIISSVRSSNLNYTYQETPFSLYMTVRKTQVKFSHTASSNPSSSSPVITQHDIETLTKENVFLKNSLLELESKLNASKEKTKVLEEKVATSEGEALKVHEQIRKWKETMGKKDDEIKCLKNVIKNNITNISKLEVEKNESKKDVKKKDKKVHDIGKANQAHQKTIQTLKEELKKHKVDKNEVDKRNKQLEKKVEGLQLKIQSLMNNNNMLSSTSPPTSIVTTLCSSSVKCLVCGKLCSDAAHLKKHSETNHKLIIDFEKLTDPDEDDPTGRFINSLPVASTPPPVSRTPPRSPPAPGKQSSTPPSPHTPPGIPHHANLASNSNPLEPNSDSPISVTQTNITSGAKFSRNLPTLPAIIQSPYLKCTHSPQCIMREPLPPPSPSLTFLYNEKTEYHIHMMQWSRKEFAGCSKCFSVENENYGCRECRWLKFWYGRHGETHGFPDIPNWMYKKYL